MAAAASAGSLVRAESQGIPNFPFLHASGAATRRLPPDLVRLQFMIKIYDPKAAVALQKLAEAEQAVLLVLGSAGIPEADIIAGDISKQAVQEQGSASFVRKAIIGYQLVRPVTVKIADLRNLAPVHERLLAQEYVENISSTFDRSDRGKVEAELAQEACANARRNADALAKGFGRAVVSVYGISDQVNGQMDIGLRHAKGFPEVTFGVTSGGFGMGIPDGITFSVVVDALFVTGEPK